MKKSSKAALLSGLILPGLGHLYLKQRVRGWTLVAASLAALTFVVDRAFEHAQSVVDQIFSGSVPLDSNAIAEAVANSTSTSDALLENIAMIVLAACWLAGIIDSYRIGTTLDP